MVNLHKLHKLKLRRFHTNAVSFQEDQNEKQNAENFQNMFHLPVVPSFTLLFLYHLSN